ncbi:MAG: hypothetical protein IJF80_04650 [Clostridia bacterium]|nr:hypothetical protein [Clostridia bacterium]
MEILGYIIAFGFIVYGLYSLINDGREKGIGFVIFEIIGVIILAALGL